MAAPDFTLKDFRGERISLTAVKGTVVILNFWSTTCGPCVQEIPSLNSLYAEFQGEGLVVLGIALDVSEKPVRELSAKLKVKYPLMLDPSQEVFFDTYGLFGQPISVIIDRSGIVREKIIGQVDWVSPHMKTKIKGYLKER